jgi:molybdate transport system substrate-binding protein
MHPARSTPHNRGCRICRRIAALYLSVYYGARLRTTARIPMRACRLLLGIPLLACVALWAPAHAAAADVTVFAASSLKEALDEQARAFRVATGHKAIVSYAASNALARQIEAGAPADVFISADVNWMDYLGERTLLAPGTRANLLRNVLVLVAPAASTATLRIAPNFGLAAALGPEKLAMANPDGVPAGRYGRSALESLGVWKSVEGQVARAESVRAALMLVSRGEAPFGIVYRTDALADKGVRIVDAFPPGSHPAIVYPIALVAGSRSPAGPALLAYLRSAPARAVWEKHGFGMAD